MSAAPTRARLGLAIEDQIRRAGANTSAALRAYVLLGMAASGLDMAPFQREIIRATAEPLATEILAALRQLLGRPTSVLQVSYLLPESTVVAPDLALDDYGAPEDAGDPFLLDLIEV